MMRTFVAAFAVAVGIGAFPAFAEERTPEELIQALGSIDFDEREAAHEQLLARGMTARAALVQGSDLPDREVRYRCRRILAILDEKEFALRIQAFENGQRIAEGEELPMWSAVRARFGEELPVRRLFADMTRDEREMLAAAAEGPQALEPVFDRRLAEVVFQINAGQMLTLGSAASFLLVCGVEGFKPKPHHVSHMNSFWHQQSYQTGIESSKARDMLRALSGDYIVQMEGPEAYMGLHWSMQFGLPRGAELARKTLDAQPQQHHVLQYAILALAKFGTEKDIPHLEPYFRDETVMHENAEDGRQRETQVRDIAVAVALHLMKRKPEEFGFGKPVHHPMVVFNTTSIGFFDAETRKKTFDAWEAFREHGTEPTGFGKTAARPEQPQMTPEELKAYNAAMEAEQAVEAAADAAHEAADAGAVEETADAPVQPE